MKKIVYFVVALFIVNSVAAQNTKKQQTGVGVTCNTDTIGETVTDIESNVYRTVTIGNQTWMKDNLKVTKYSNGDSIPTLLLDTVDLTEQIEPKFQWAFECKERYAQKYGRLYTWYVVTDSRNVCPTGWHVPSDDEYCILENAIEPGSDVNCDIMDHRGKNQGDYMKETCTYWFEPRTSADNRSGFSVLPAGIRYNNGFFDGLTHYAYFWTTTEFNTESARSRRFYYNKTDVSRGEYFKASSLSVRCVKD